MDRGWAQGQEAKSSKTRRIRIYVVWKFVFILGEMSIFSVKRLGQQNHSISKLSSKHQAVAHFKLNHALRFFVYDQIGKVFKKIVATQIKGAVHNFMPRKKQEICFNTFSKIPPFKTLTSEEYASHGIVNVCLK